MYIVQLVTNTFSLDHYHQYSVTSNTADYSTGNPLRSHHGHGSYFPLYLIVDQQCTSGHIAAIFANFI